MNNLTPKQRAFAAIELAGNLLYQAKNNMHLLEQVDLHDIQQLIDETLIEFISDNLLKPFSFEL